MNVIDWSLSALDKIFSSRKASPGEAKCPDGTDMAGFVRDNWASTWQILCIEPLLVEDVEDLFIFGFLVAGFFLLGLGTAFVYRKNCQTGEITQHLSDSSKTKFAELSERVMTLEQRLNHGFGQILELNRTILAKSSELLKAVEARRGVRTE